MDRSTGEAGPSTTLSVGPVPWGPDHFKDIALYPAVNHPSQLTEEKLEKFYDAYHIPRGVYELYLPEPSDRIFHTPPVVFTYANMVIGISQAAFQCGFRVPLLRLYKALFRQMNIAFGQMDPNGFIHINSFQNRCLTEKIHPFTRLFWFHYDFRKNSKSNDFYTIARRSGRADWAATNSSNKKTHTHWCFISGMKLAEFNVWRAVEPSKLLIPILGPEEQQVYAKLVNSEVS